MTRFYAILPGLDFQNLNQLPRFESRSLKFSKISISNIEDYSSLGCTIDFANLGVNSGIAGECIDHPGDDEYM